MSQTLPRNPRPYSLASAFIGARLNLDGCKGSEPAKLLWFVILSHTPWDTLTRPTWATNVTLAHEAGLDARDVRRGLQVLREAGLITTPTGHRPGAKRPTGRILAPRLGSPVKVLIPDRGEITNLWLTCGEIRKRPAALVTLVVGMHALAAFELDARPTAWSLVPGRLADLRRFVGARKNAAWTQRVRDLEALGLLRRNGRTVWLAPPIVWDQTARAMARFRHEKAPA